MRKKFLSTGLAWLWVAILVLGVDRYAKSWAITHLVFGEPLRLLPVFNLTLAYNTGAAFSFLHNASGWQNVFLGSLAFIVSIIILCWLYRLPARARWTNVALCLVLSGALGNAWDRLLYGYVIDFFDFHLGDWHFAIFNTADSAICIGAFMLMLHWIKYPK
ncbi:MAG: lipoprotein signal peptidase [Gammaproteobacteria bacterium]|nr:MAG: lipoprotein signal peptidase [Gammaproteobacteria bacterium]